MVVTRASDVIEEADAVELYKVFSSTKLDVCFIKGKSPFCGGIPQFRRPPVDQSHQIEVGCKRSPRIVQVVTKRKRGKA